MTKAPCPDCEHLCASYEDPDPGACGCGTILTDIGCDAELSDPDVEGDIMERAERTGKCPYFEMRAEVSMYDYLTEEEIAEIIKEAKE